MLFKIVVKVGSFTARSQSYKTFFCNLRQYCCRSITLWLIIPQILVIYAEKILYWFASSYIGKIIKLNFQNLSLHILKFAKNFQDSMSHFFLSSQVLDNFSKL